jgi:hypothetical protein
VRGHDTPAGRLGELDAGRSDWLNFELLGDLRLDRLGDGTDLVDLCTVNTIHNQIRL